MVVFDVVVGGHVQRGRDTEVGVEPVVHGPSCGHSSPSRIPPLPLLSGRCWKLQAQVPLAHHGGVVAHRLQQRGDGDLVVPQAAIIAAKGIPSGEQAVSTGRAQPDGGVGVGKLHPLDGKAVDIGRGHFKV